ncbi:hypothetical protein FE257_011493 [Aspergillus nanangensis]|uniref:BHLH domain-containing protein n=1 Tax=Aspergillus nanangensis TaxID=2582783 RepID=A0AAD4GSF6_ASPNN|nr:hypothetical protein FE257_011493 [Aspergillus nanangensis]
MAYPRPDTTAFTMDNDDRIYMNSPMHRPIDGFTGPKGPDPLSGNWNYDSAIDLFSLNTTMLSDPFPLDMSNEMVGVDPKEFPADFFAPPPDISGFAISNHSGEDSVSSDLESDDQSWSPTYAPSTNNNTSETSSRRQTEPNPQQQLEEETQCMPTRMQRWSSSPELMPQEYASSPQQPMPASLPTNTGINTSTANRKMTRSMSGDSNASTGQQTGSTPSGRNAAKRAAHNIIEKRYRTNMNAKFVALEKAMCGGVQKQTKGGPASLKKSEILTNAIAYMHELQEENKALHKELALFKQNLLPAGGMWRARE